MRAREISRGSDKIPVPARLETCHVLAVAPPVSPGSGRVRGIRRSRLINMRKFAIASLLLAGVALSGSVLAQDAAPQAAPATKPAASQPASSSSSSSHHKNKKNKATPQPGQPNQKGGHSAKRTAKSTLPQTEASH
jgi:hypothetical protein